MNLAAIDIQSGVKIPVKGQAAILTDKSPVRQSQVILLPTTITTGFGGRIKSVYDR